jgi:hypothetical protein
MSAQHDASLPWDTWWNREICRRACGKIAARAAKEGIPGFSLQQIAYMPGCLGRPRRTFVCMCLKLFGAVFFAMTRS